MKEQKHAGKKTKQKKSQTSLKENNIKNIYHCNICVSNTSVLLLFICELNTKNTKDVK